MNEGFEKRKLENYLKGGFLLERAVEQIYMFSRRLEGEWLAVKGSKAERSRKGPAPDDVGPSFFEFSALGRRASGDF